MTGDVVELIADGSVGGRPDVFGYSSHLLLLFITTVFIIVKDGFLLRRGATARKLVVRLLSWLRGGS